MKKLICLISFIALLGTYTNLNAQTTKTWVGITSAWGTASNWSPSGVPASIDHIVITSGTPLLDANRSVKNITVSGGTVNLNGFTLTITGTTSLSAGTVNSGIISFSNTTTTFSGTTFGSVVTVSAQNINFNGSIFNGNVTATKTASGTNTSTGANTFNGTLDLRVNAGEIALNPSGGTKNAYNNNVQVSTTGSGILGFGGTGNQLASGKTITIGSGGWAAGTLKFTAFEQLGTTAQTLTLTGTTTILEFGSGNTWAGKLTVSAPIIKFNGATFSKKVIATKSGSGDAICSGGNTFNDTLDLRQSAGQWLMHNSTSNDAFNGHVFVSNTGSGGIYFGSTSTGTGTLASGKIISVGANGFSNGTLGLRRFTQTGSTAQNITLTGTTTTLAIGGTDASGLVTWNGNITTSSANVTIANTTCNGKATFTKTGTSSNFCVGNNTFNDTLKIYVNNSGFVKLTNTLSDTYNSGVEYRLASTGLIASGTTATYKGNLFIATNNNNISFGGSITFSGTNSQSISKSGTGAIRTETIVINKASNNLTIYNNLGADAITLTSGKIIANSPTDTLKLGGAAPSGGSSTSYIDAALTFRITYAATNYTLPIGSGSVYQPVTINAPSVGSKSDFFFRYFGQGQLLGSSADTSVANLSYCEYWRVVQISGTATSPYITFGWKSTSCNAAKPANMRVARWTGSQWVNEGNGASTGNNTAGTVRTNGTQATQGYYTISNKTCSYAASITPTGATSFCPGGDVTLTANSSKYYNWSTGATSQAIVSGANGIHTVIVRDTSGCKGTANQTLTVYPKPIAEAGNDTTITYSENFILGTSTAGYSGTAPYSYLWTAVNFIDSINIKRPRIYIESEDAVVFKVTDANGCFDVDTLDISVLYSTSSSNEDLECWTPNITFQTTYSPVGCINYLQDLENGILNERTYRLKVHVFQKDDTTGDFSLSDSSYIRNIVNELNDVYSNLQSPTLLVDTNITIPTIIDSKIRFNVIGEINFHQDTEAWKGSSRRVKFYKPSISITSNYIDNDSNYIVIPQTRFRDYYLNQISSTNQVKLINFDDFTEYDLLIDTVTPFQNNKSKVKISGDLNLPPSAANYRIAYNYGQKIISVDTVQRVFVLKGFKPEIRGDFDVNFEGYFRNGKGKIELGIPTDSILINYFNNTSVKFSIDSVYGSGTLTGGLTYVKVNEPISNISNTAIVYTWYVEKNIAPVGTAWQFDKIKHKYFSDKSFVHLYFNGVDYITDKTGGYGKPNFLEMNNFNSSLPTAPGLRSLLKHEIGHTIGLPHPSDNVDGICSWQDTYWDTFHPDCESGDCNTSTISNNIMGQSNCRNYLSPLQINKLYEVVTNYQDGLIYTGCSVGGGDPFHVSSNQTWLNTRAFDGDLIIDPGVTLIVKCTVNMAKHTRVIIKNDSLGLQNAGKLIIDGGTFTNGCYQFWKGIEVWGDRTASQTASPQKQGIIEVKNGGRIENALTGISTIRRNSNGSLNWAYTGGIVRIDSAYFINNVQGINILSYHSTASSPEPYNRSYIRNSNFETNYNWPNVEKKFYEFIGIFDVRGIILSGNTYANIRNQNTFVSEGGLGVNVLDGDLFTVKNYCQNLGCTNVVQNKFSGLAKGVMVRNTLDIPFSGKVTKSKFQNNLFGTVAFGGNTIRITENDFFMRTDSLYDFIAAGVALFGNTGYVVTENNFTRLGNVSGPNTFGVAVVNSGDFDNEIRLNNFDSLGFASYSEGDNRGPAVSNGLLFKCNSNNKNGYDIFVEATDTVDQGIAENQGSDINTESVAGNVFSRYSLSTEVDFINNGGPINYFHHDSTSNAFVKPLDKIGVITLVDTEIDYTVGSCLSFINETKPTIKLRIANNASNLFPRLTIHNSLTDNGNTGSLINRIDTTSTASKASLRTYLLSLSPYLSNESLLHAASLNAFDNADIVDILTVNPHGSRYQRLVDTLSTKIKPFNVGQLQDIGDLQANITGRDTLIANINFLNTDRKSNIEELIYLHLTDTAYNGLDSSIAILRGENTLWSGYKLVSCYLQNGQDNYAMNVLDSLPIRYKISGVELKNYRDYKYLVRKADSLGTIKNSYKWNNLDSSSIARLQTMSNTNAFWPGMQACNILMLIGVDTCTVQLNASIVSPRLAQDIDVSSPIKQVSPKENFMKLYPNPAQGTVNVKYELNKLTNNQTFIEIYTLTGAKTYSQNLSGVTGTIQIDISNLQQGLYFVVLKNGSTIVGADKLIVN